MIIWSVYYIMNIMNYFTLYNREFWNRAIIKKKILQMKKNNFDEYYYELNN